MVYVIGMGSNEHRKENLRFARKRLKELFPEICFSTEEETEPIGMHRTALFANQVARFVSNCHFSEINALLKAIEREAGRTPEDKQQEIIRLDLDLLGCDAIIYRPEELRRDYLQRGLKEVNYKYTI